MQCCHIPKVPFRTTITRCSRYTFAVKTAGTDHPVVRRNPTVVSSKNQLASGILNHTTAERAKGEARVSFVCRGLSTPDPTRRSRNDLERGGTTPKHRTGVRFLHACTIWRYVCAAFNVLKNRHAAEQSRVCVSSFETRASAKDKYPFERRGWKHCQTKSICGRGHVYLVDGLDVEPVLEIGAGAGVNGAPDVRPPLEVSLLQNTAINRKHDGWGRGGG